MPNNLTPYLGTIFRSILVLPLIWMCRLSNHFDQKFYVHIQQFIDWDFKKKLERQFVNNKTERKV